MIFYHVFKVQRLALASEKLPCVHYYCVDKLLVYALRFVQVLYQERSASPATAITYCNKVNIDVEALARFCFERPLVDPFTIDFHITTIMTFNYVYNFALILALGVSAAFAINCKGCTPLDSLSFDKLLSKFKVSVIKFDVAYPYGDKHEEFAKFSVSASELDDLFIGEVGIKDYGDKDNADLAERFEVLKDDYPVCILFVQDANGKLSDHRFAGEFKEDNLKSFVRQKSGLYLPLPGCLEAFDNLADSLMTAPDAGTKGKVIVQAEKVRDTLKDEQSKKADIYIKVMHKVASEGEAFIDKEMERVKKVMEGKVSEGKKKQLEHRINILKSFARQKTKDEL